MVEVTVGEESQSVPECSSTVMGGYVVTLSPLLRDCVPDPSSGSKDGPAFWVEVALLDWGSP